MKKATNNTSLQKSFCKGSFVYNESRFTSKERKIFVNPLAENLTELDSRQ